VERIDTPRYQITLQPDFPIPGPNNVSWIRCLPDEADDVIREARATIAPRHLPVMWMLDPETEPPDFAEHLARHDVHPDPHGGDVAVMVYKKENKQHQHYTDPKKDRNIHRVALFSHWQFF